MATETSSTGRESDKFMLRLPDGMRERIKEAAKASGRTLNSEIVRRLEDSFAPPPPAAQVALSLAAEEDPTSPRRLLDRMARLEEIVGLLHDERDRSMDELQGKLQSQKLKFNGEGSLVHGANPDDPAPLLHETQRGYAVEPEPPTQSLAATRSRVAIKPAPAEAPKRTRAKI